MTGGNMRYSIYRHSNLDGLTYHYDKPPIIQTESKAVVDTYLHEAGAIYLRCGSKFRREWVTEYQSKKRKMEIIDVHSAVSTQAWLEDYAVITDEDRGKYETL